MADAGTGLDAGYLGVLHAGADQPCAAPGNQQIHIAHGGHQGVGGGVGGVLDQADRIFRQAVLPQSLPQRLYNGVGAAPCLLAAAQDAGVAALDGKGGGIAGHVGTAFVDDSNHTHGHGGLFDHQPVGALHPLQHPAHRVGQGSDLFNALCHGADALLGQGKTIQHHLADMSLCSGHIVGVGGKDSRHVCRAAQLRSHTAQCLCAAGAISQCQRSLCPAGGFQNFLCGHSSNLLCRQCGLLMPGKAGADGLARSDIIQQFRVCAVGDDHIRTAAGHHAGSP